MAMLRSLAKAVSPLAVVSAAVLLMAAPVPAQSRPGSETVVPNRLVQPIDDGARVTLRGYVHPLANAANDRGPAPDSMPLTRMHLVLRRSADQEAALRQYIDDAHTPGSAH